MAEELALAGEFILRNAPTYFAVMAIMLLAVRGRLRLALRSTIAVCVAVVAAMSLASGFAVACWTPRSGTYVGLPIAAASLAVFAACTRIGWGKRLFVFFSGMAVGAFSVLAYDVALRAFGYALDFWPRRALEAAVCVVVPLLLAPLFARSIRWAVEHVNDAPLWRALSAMPVAFFALASAIYAFAYETAFETRLALPLYTLAVALLMALLAASYATTFAALRTTTENARLRERAQLADLQRSRYEDLQARMREAARIRHDARHQLMVIRSFAEAEDSAGLRAYLDGRDDGAAARALKDGSAYCPNFAVDAVAAHYAARARACGAETLFAFALPERLPVAETDFCMALANLLENAVEACERVAADDGVGARPFVHAEARIVGRALVLSVENSCTEADASSLVEAAPNGSLTSRAASAKRNGAGVGLASVADLAARYRGEARVTCADGAAAVRMVLLGVDEGS